MRPAGGIDETNLRDRPVDHDIAVPGMARAKSVTAAAFQVMTRRHGRPGWQARVGGHARKVDPRGRCREAQVETGRIIDASPIDGESDPGRDMR